MKQILIVFMVSVFLFSCGGLHTQREINANKEVLDRKDSKRGVLIVDMLSLKQKNLYLNFYDKYDPNQIVISIDQEHFILDHDTCFYYLNTCNYFKQSSFKAFNLEFDLFILDGVSQTEKGYQISINDGEVFIPRNRLLKFETYKEHLRNNFLSLDEANPLRVQPYKRSKEVPGFLNYEYQVLEFKDDWVKVKSIEEYEDELTGWVKWISNDSLLIESLYSF